MTSEVVAAVAALVVQLSPRRDTPDRTALSEMVSSPGTSLLVVRDPDAGIVGMLTLVTFRIPTQRCAWIEDVVVHERARGRGLGEMLIRAALRIAEQAGAETVNLTSSPEREAANRLYQRLGFLTRETNLYRFELS